MHVVVGGTNSMYMHVMLTVLYKSSTTTEVSTSYDYSFKMDSTEYKTLTQCYPTLVTCIQQAPNDVAVQLRPYGILAPKDILYLSNSSHDPDEKARRLIDTVLTQVQIDPQVYDKFISALKAAGPWTNSAVSLLDTTYTALQASTRAGIIDSPHKRGGLGQ